MKIARQNTQCAKCRLHRTTDSVCVWGEGPATADYMLIGEAPGADEEREQRPFVGRAGRTLRKALDEANITNFYLTNIVRCRPPDNRDPQLDEIKACAPYLNYELRKIKPKVVITLGNFPTKAILKKTQITKIHGQITEKDDTLYMPTYHPSYVNRDPSTRPDFVADLKKAKHIFENGIQKDQFRWKRVTKSTVDRFLHDLEICNEFAFDTETTGLDPYNEDSRINCIGFSLDTGTNWILPLKDNSNLRFPLIREIHKRLKNKPSVAHSEKFDNNFLLSKFGVLFENTDDTMLMHHLLDENKHHDLKSLSRTLLNAPEYDIPKKEKVKLTAKTMRYCAKDTAYTLQLNEIFHLKLDEDRALWDIYHKLTLPASKVLTYAENRGLFIRKKLFNDTIEKTKAELIRLEKQLTRLSGREINWNSSQQISEFLFDELGLIPEIYTPKGAPSTSETALRTFRKENSIVKTLFEYRELEKFRSTYLDGWRDLIQGDRIYFSTMIHGTVTGRFSSRLHTIPKDGTIRNLISAEPGWTFIAADFSQAELRTIAIVSKDPELLRCYKHDIDVHWRTLCGVIPLIPEGEYAEPALKTASKLGRRTMHNLTEACDLLLGAGFDACKKMWSQWDNARKKTKAINFGFVYGQSAIGCQTYLAEKFDMNLELAEVEDFRNAFFSLYRLEAWHNKQKKLVHLNGYVRNLFGRIRRLPKIHSSEKALVRHAERQAINSPIQGFIGDFKTAALVNLAKEFPQNKPGPLHILGEVHDSILMEIQDEYLNTTLPVVREIMESPPTVADFGIRLPIPMTVDMEVGPWGAGEKV